MAAAFQSLAIMLLHGCSREQATDGESGLADSDGTEDTSCDLEVTRVSPTEGRVGDPVLITGCGLLGREVAFGSVNAAIIEDTAHALIAIVPVLAAGDADILVDSERVGSFTVVRVSGTADLCPTSNPAGGPVQITGERLPLEGFVRFTQFGTTIGTSWGFLHAEGSLPIVVPSNLEAGLYDVLVDTRAGVLDGGSFEVLADYPPGPSSPSRIEYPEPYDDFIPPITNTWFSDGGWSFFLEPDDGEECGSNDVGDFTVIQSPPDTPEYAEWPTTGSGTHYNGSGFVTLELQFPHGVVEEYRGYMSVEVLDGSDVWQMTLYSDRTCRQLVLRNASFYECNE